MKKRTIQWVLFVVSGFLMLSVSVEVRSQSAAKVKEAIEQSSEDFMRWFNNGHVDSLLNSYSKDACLVAYGCGKDIIREYFESQIHLYKFKELEVLSVNVDKNLAVEKGRWVVELENGGEIEGEYLTEWHRKGNKWLIVNDISNTVR
jgi:ketosteroid isomerase-like protein